MLRGTIKLVAAVLLWVILLPPFLTLACALSPHPAPLDLLTALADVIPFGSLLAEVVAGLLTGLLSGSVPDLLIHGPASMPEGLAFWTELVQAILVTVLFCVVSAVLRQLLVGRKGNFLECLANFLVQVLFSFLAAWLGIVILDFFSAQAAQLAGLAQAAVCGLVTLIVVGGGLAVMVVLANVFLIGVGLFLLRGVVINVLKLLVTYLACFAFLLALESAQALIAAPVVAMVWVLIMVGLFVWDYRLGKYE